MTLKCGYDSVVGVILPVENKLLPIVHLILKLTKTQPLLCQKHSGCVSASGKITAPHIIYYAYFIFGSVKKEIELPHMDWAQHG